MGVANNYNHRYKQIWVLVPGSFKKKNTNQNNKTKTKPQDLPGWLVDIGCGNSFYTCY